MIMLKGHRARTTALLAVALAGTLPAAGCGDGAGAEPRITTTTRAGVAPEPPAKGAYFGVWAAPPPLDGRPAPTEPPASAGPLAPGRGATAPGMAPVAALERGLGRQVDIVQRYYGWKAEFPGPEDRAVAAGPRQLMITWKGGDTKEIISGRFDRLIQARAHAIKALGKPVFLRWRDMDAGALAGRVHDAPSFVAAWKHVRAIFAAEGVATVAWVWCPTANGFGGRNAPSYYPGDDQVDWICTDAEPTPSAAYMDLSESTKLFFDWAKDRPKPVMIGEFGAPVAYGPRRAEWLRRAAVVLQNPQVKAVLYFDSDERAEERRDTRRRYAVDGDARAVSALRELATLPYFNPRNVPVTPGR
jgi:hypothetical protein